MICYFSYSYFDNVSEESEKKEQSIHTHIIHTVGNETKIAPQRGFFPPIHVITCMNFDNLSYQY